MSASVESFLTDSIAKHYGLLRGGRKLLARHARVHVSTADRWLSGERTPDGPRLIALMAECEALRNDVIKFAGGQFCDP